MEHLINSDCPIRSAIEGLRQALSPVGSESISIDNAPGRVLAEPLRADRDSPALSVSAMDGYAVRLTDLKTNDSQITLPIQATTAAGSPPETLLKGSAIQIFTGAPVPSGADAVIKREDTTESAEQITIDIAKCNFPSGMHIRQQGENAKQGAELLPAGTLVTSAAMAAVASFGAPQAFVRKPVRVSILNTGDELAAPGEAVEDWQIRDSNGPCLRAWLSQIPWTQVVRAQHVGDSPAAVQEALRASLHDSDAVLLTGGVSMGDTDYVPGSIQAVGGEISFHRLPLRPGKPVLGAHYQGKLILGLPGNPVSVAVTSRVFGEPLLRTLSGNASIPNQPLVQVGPPTSPELTRALHLHWYRLVETKQDGSVEYIVSRGSGDLVSLARSDGFVEVPPHQTGSGPWRLTLWDQ